MSYIIGVPILMIVSGIAEAWAIGILWGWYVTPIFGVATPTGIQCYGLALLSALLCNQYVPTPRDVESSDKLWRLHFVFTRPLLIVAVAWVARRLFA